MITLITGGTRSGKSREAERIALARSPHPTYLATAKVLDEEMADRVRRHHERRQHQWHNIEEPLWLGQLDSLKGQVVLLDCLTLWSTNVFFHVGEDPDEALVFIKEQWAEMRPKVSDMILVTNEIGMGGISPNAMMRKFTDLQGWVNQFFAAQADEVILMVSGIPVKIK